MKIQTQFVTLTQAQIDQLGVDLTGVLSEQDRSDFLKYTRPYEKLGSQQLDDIFLVAQVTIRGRGEVKELKADCSVDQENWVDFEDEPDIRIDPISIPFQVRLPKTPFEVAGVETFLVVLEAAGNIWDSCKDLPSWIWDEGKFDFMLMFNVTDGKGEVHYGNYGGEYASQLITF